MYMESPQNSYFQPGEHVVSITYHPPEVKSGTKATIVSPKFGSLYAVKLPDGELHTWFAQPELEPVHNNSLRVGEYARVIYNNGHPPEIQIGTVVQIVKVVPDVFFYDLILEDCMYHRWLADFELASPI